MKILIIEDEPLTADDLAQTLRKIDASVEVVGILDSVSSSVRYLSGNPMPGLIYMDIQLSDGLSFDIFQQVKITCPVIFCTAYDEYAIHAFKLNGVDFILKPFDIHSIRKSVDKIALLKAHFQKESQYTELFSTLLNALKPPTRSSFLINHKGKMIPVAAADIAYFYVEDELVFIFTFGGQRYIIDHSLEELEKLVDSTRFYRANRQFLISFDAIKEIEPYFNRKLVVKLRVACSEQILVGKLKVTEFRAWLADR